MAALAWLLIPFAAAVGAAVWSVWAARRPSGAGDAEGVAGYEAFRAAMERPQGLPDARAHRREGAAEPRPAITPAAD
ncbi:hypothetical protein V1L54_05480 [Streptomyces sp. TRM 70361]|uniref:hypothetical protein n=1 Tax=Streptomyces sp. TRM 70361 TaxID=3116553 RepID=UPI002E7B7D8C|nr:hypothetical protein [Streptomyces sp. TRM 70361]MEE1938868.1 hypothetical protein [Streptomyces sp. TRM 70361]